MFSFVYIIPTIKSILGYLGFSLQVFGMAAMLIYLWFGDSMLGYGLALVEMNLHNFPYITNFTHIFGT